MEGAAGHSDVELLSRTLQVEHKLFYFDFKENPRGRYLKISEKTSGSRSTIIVPVAGIVWFVDLFNYYANGDDREILSKELQLDTKVFYFDVGENKRGRFLKATDNKRHAPSCDTKAQGNPKSKYISKAQQIGRHCNTRVPEQDFVSRKSCSTSERWDLLGSMRFVLIGIMELEIIDMMHVELCGILEHELFGILGTDGIYHNLLEGGYILEHDVVLHATLSILLVTLVLVVGQDT